MSATTHIQWTDATWNPVTGCDKVSAGCKHCYAQREWARLSANPKTIYFGRAFGDVRTHPDALRVPLAWRKPRMVFVCSMSDLFHPAVPDEFIVEVFYAMQLANQHTYQVLTKRPERARTLLKRLCRPEHPACGNMLTLDGAPARHFGGDARAFLADEWPLPNVWVGTSVENQAAADERVPLLLDTPARVRFLSIEPMLGDIRLGSWLQRSPSAAFEAGKITADMPAWTRLGATAIDWVICGGESGQHARPMHTEWVISLRDQCAAAGVAFFFKQWGEWAPQAALTLALRMKDCGQFEQLYVKLDGSTHWIDPDDSTPYSASDALMLKIGKKAAGRRLDGVEHSAWPT